MCSNYGHRLGAAAAYGLSWQRVEQEHYPYLQALSPACSLIVSSIKEQAIKRHAVTATWKLESKQNGVQGSS